MSLLPQRKKSAEEIAKLRESFGIPGAAPEVAESPAVAPEPSVAVAVAEPAPKEPEAEPVVQKEDALLAPHDLGVVQPIAPPKQVRSLKRSERTPVSQVSEPVSASPAAAVVSSSKMVRSLRKSERLSVVAAENHTPPPDSTLPFHRHSDEELNEIRRQAAILRQAPGVVPFAAQTAHLALVIPGYLLALGGGACFYYYEFPIGVTGACAGLALLISILIFLKKPLSRHHAAFISVIVMFVIVFGALYYFPQLRHGA